MLILSQPSFRLHGLSKTMSAMIRLFEAYYRVYRYPQFRTSLEYMFFEYLLPQLNEVLSRGFSAEIIAFRGYLENILLPKLVHTSIQSKSVFSSSNKSMDIDSTTLDTLRHLKVILKACSIS